MVIASSPIEGGAIVSGLVDIDPLGQWYGNHSFMAIVCSLVERLLAVVLDLVDVCLLVE